MIVFTKTQNVCFLIFLKVDSKSQLSTSKAEFILHYKTW